MTKYPKDDDIAFIWIHSPVTPFSSEDELIAWIQKLKAMPDRPEVREEIEIAERYLARKSIGGE